MQIPGTVCGIIFAFNLNILLKLIKYTIQIVLNLLRRGSSVAKLEA